MENRYQLAQYQRLSGPYNLSITRQKAIQSIFADRKQDLQPVWSTVQKAAQTAPRGRFPMYFLTSFMVLLRQLRRLYASGSIFQVPPVYNYSTYRTNPVLTRFDIPSTRLRVRFVYASSILLKHQLRGEVRQYIDHVAHLNTIDSHHRLKEHTILYVFRAPRHDSLVLLNQYEPIYSKEYKDDILKPIKIYII